MTMQRLLLLAGTLAMIACAASPQETADPADVAAVLDDFHAAADDADFDRYFSHFVDDGVFFGTDPEERWPVEEFRPYAARRFEDGVGWTYVPRDRNIFFSDDGRTAWFDEMLDNPSGLVARGTGVLVRQEDEWKVAQYHITIPFPNALWRPITTMIREHEEEEPGQ